MLIVASDQKLDDGKGVGMSPDSSHDLSLCQEQSENDTNNSYCGFHIPQNEWVNNKEYMEDMDHNGDVSWLTDTISCLPHEADSGGEVMNTRVSLSKHFSSRSTTPCEPIPILVYQCLGATHVEDHRVEATQWIHILQVTTMYIHITVFIGLHLSSVTERKLEKLLLNLTGSYILPLKVS